MPDRFCMKGVSQEYSTYCQIYVNNKDQIAEPFVQRPTI